MTPSQTRKKCHGTGKVMPLELCPLRDFHNLTCLPVKTSDVRERAGNFGAAKRPREHQER